MSSYHSEFVEDEIVLSEVHMEGSTYASDDYFVLRVKVGISLKEKMENEEDQTLMIEDEDGDFDIQNKLSSNMYLNLKHQISTPLSSVGLQIWRGAFLMTDFILSSDIFENAYCIELGAGVGLSSIALASKSKHVYCTDNSEKVLNLCQENIDLNLGVISYNSNDCIRNITLRELNWTDNKWSERINSSSKYSWQSKDKSILKRTDVIVSADCIYDDALTDSLFNTITTLVNLSLKKKVAVLFSIEKRINFTLNDLDAVAPAYDYFKKKLYKLTQENLNSQGAFTAAEQISLTFAHYLDYERSKHLELWKFEFEKMETTH